jgi:hypothetical protein
MPKMQLYDFIIMLLLWLISLSFIHQKSNLLVIEIQESPFFMNCMTTKIIPQENMPIWLKCCIQGLFQVLCNLILQN